MPSHPLANAQAAQGRDESRQGGSYALGNLGDRIAAGLALAAFLFLAGVVYVGLTMPARPQEETYILQIDAKADGEAVVAQGTTTLPDGSRLEVFVDRLYRLRGSDIWSAARVGGVQVIVRDQAWQATIPIDDSAWVEEVSRQVSERALDPVETVLPVLRASVVFSPVVPQAQAVQARLGPNFERLSDSEQAVNVGGIWILSHSDTVELPMDRELEKRLVPAGA